MSESSRARVTITLGRSGQVVKRDVSDADTLPIAGSKRSVRDRLGSNSDSYMLHGRQLDNKRQRGDISISSRSSNGVSDAPIGMEDLRYKLMQKHIVRRARVNNDGKVIDLREKLSKSGPSPASSHGIEHRIPGPKDTGFVGRIPPTRSADDLPRLDSLRSSYSTWTLDHLRRRSPDGIIGASRNLSPQRNIQSSQRRPAMRAMDDVGPLQYMRSEVLNHSRIANSSSFMPKPTLPPGSAKSAALPLGQLRPPSGIVQKSTYVGDEHQTVEGLLNSLGLGKYAILFKAEEIDMTALRQMGENDLKELGIPMGPRKKILLALLPRTKRQS